jgi:hypothetical protein
MKDRRKPPFWRQTEPAQRYDIAVLRPASLPRGERFETLEDAQAESERSEQLLRPIGRARSEYTKTLLQCGDGDRFCDKPYCPICARTFRRWLTGELLRITGNNDGAAASC